jgi:prevent-host-death family protein
MLHSGDYMKRPTKPVPRRKANSGRPSIGIRELKAKASAIIDEVKARRISYAVTKRGRVEALIVPSDAGERLLNHDGDSAWNAWQILIDQLLNESRKKRRSAVVELEQIRR